MQSQYSKQEYNLAPWIQCLERANQTGWAVGAVAVDRRQAVAGLVIVRTSIEWVVAVEVVAVVAALVHRMGLEQAKVRLVE